MIEAYLENYIDEYDMAEYYQAADKEEREFILLTIIETAVKKNIRGKSINEVSVRFTLINTLIFLLGLYLGAIY